MGEKGQLLAKSEAGRIWKDPAGQLLQIEYRAAGTVRKASLPADLEALWNLCQLIEAAGDALARAAIVKTPSDSQHAGQRRPARTD